MRHGILAFLLLAACASRKPPARPDYVETTKSPPFKPPERPKPGETPWDWVQLTSDEWLKGEIKYVRDYTLEIDSDELDILKFSWRKVKVLRSPRLMTMLLDNQYVLRGPVIVQDGKVVVKDSDEAFSVFPRANLLTIVPGGLTERSYWSGKLSLGLTLRSGNTEQLDSAFGFSIRRRAPRSRFQFDYLGNFSKANGEEIANNQRATGRFDIYVARRWYATPLAVDVYRDPFQNIDARVTPLAGAGYYIFKKGLDQNQIDWDVSALAGYRWTRYQSGEVDSEGTFTVGLTTRVEWDITANLETSFSYDFQMGVPDTEDSNQNLSWSLEWDVWKDLDLEFTVVWNYVGNPQADGAGDVPKRSDLKLIFGFGWEF